MILTVLPAGNFLPSRSYISLAHLLLFHNSMSTTRGLFVNHCDRLPGALSENVHETFDQLRTHFGEMLLHLWKAGTHAANLQDEVFIISKAVTMYP
ncbi:hypothetical protein BD410DRAFT_118194 [Rickenella mellea]|uniref:Uncharacterized protein n=1 Tax=Rickenella mellea TaxID=50990 RepID=A0A4Y7QB87_9AGAM|nr:hypothetical protein BD410DRAFT_118194 [Rickenella mellea]